MLHKQYQTEQDKLVKLQNRKNEKSDFYNGIIERYKDPILTRNHIPVFWKYDLDSETNPYFQERLGVNAVMNSGAIELDGKYYLVVRVEGADRKSFFAVAESDTGAVSYTHLGPVLRVHEVHDASWEKYTAGVADRRS